MRLLELNNRILCWNNSIMTMPKKLLILARWVKETPTKRGVNDSNRSTQRLRSSFFKNRDGATEYRTSVLVRFMAL